MQLEPTSLNQRIRPVGQLLGILQRHLARQRKVRIIALRHDAAPA